MSLVKVRDLICPALDYAVAVAAGHKVEIRPFGRYIGTPKEKLLGYLIYLDPAQHDEFGVVDYTPSTDWSIGGSIIGRENISIVCCEGDYNPDKSGTPDCYDTYWIAEMRKQNANTVYGSQGDDYGVYYLIDSKSIEGSTPLIAAMRCYVHSIFGEYIEIPDTLIT